MTVSKMVWLLLDSRGAGGIETHIYHLAVALKERGIPVRVYFFQDYGPHPLITALQQKNIPVNHFFGSIRNMSKRLQSGRPQLIHCHGYKMSILGRILGTRCSIPVVSTFHNGDMGSGFVRLYTMLDRLTAFLSHNITVFDQSLLGGLIKTKRIANFLPLPSFNQKHVIGRQVAFVGRLSAEKGPKHFCQLATREPSLSWSLFGDGPLRSSLESQYGQQVQFYGMVDDMRRYWSKLDLLVITSKREGLPLVALEAMSHGIPVIAFAVGGLKRLIVHGCNGFLVPEGNQEALYDALQRWQKRSEDQKQLMRRWARQTIIDHYTPDVVVPKIEQVYRYAVSGA
ncbi:glycosyltransferase family 4 protein [Magnetococcales bacterium HHB-1]